jgi:hypothetical protein
MKAKALSYSLIKKKVGQFLVKNRTKIINNTTRPCPHDITGTSPRPKNSKAQTRKNNPTR